jgi:PEP-CTERM motif
VARKKSESLTLAALAAAPVAAIGAVVVPPVQGYETPSFSCDAASGGGSVNWGDGLSVMPEIGTDPLSCANGVFEETIKLTNDTLTLNLNELKSGAGETLYDLKIDGIKGESQDDKHKDALFDTYLESSNSYTKSDFKISDFVGIKIDSSEEFFKFDSSSFNSDFKVISLNFSPDVDIKTFAAFDAFADLTPSEVTVSLYSTPEAVPEPATIGLLGTGLLGLAMRLRRRTKA